MVSHHGTYTLVPLKTFLYRITDATGVNVGTWGGSANASTPVLSEPSFTAEVDSGLSSLSVSLALPFDYAGADLTKGNLVETYCKPDDGDEVLIHGGILETIKRTATATGDTVEVSITPYISELSRDYFRDNDTTGISHIWTSTEIATILKTILEKTAYMRSIFSRVHASSTSVQNSGKTVSVQIGSETYLSAIQRVKKMGPGNFYYFVDASGVFWYRNFDSGTHHVFTLGKDAMSLSMTDDLSDLRNVVYFWNQSDADGTMIALERSNASSTALYGRRAEIVTDSRIDSTAAAEAAVSAYLTEHSSPIETYEVDVLSSSKEDTKGYPIESIRPGDSCEIRNVPLLSGKSFSIVRVDYSPDSVKLTLGIGPVRRPSTLGKTIEEMAEFARQSTDGSVPTTTTA